VLLKIYFSRIFLSTYRADNKTVGHILLRASREYEYLSTSVFSCYLKTGIIFHRFYYNDTAGSLLPRLVIQQ